VADGSTKSETTPARHLPTSGDRPLDAVIMDERRDGPRRLCDDDDDDDDVFRVYFGTPKPKIIFVVEICVRACSSNSARAGSVTSTT